MFYVYLSSTSIFYVDLSPTSLVDLISNSISPTLSPSLTLSLSDSIYLSEPLRLSLLPVATYLPSKQARGREREGEVEGDGQTRARACLERLQGRATEIHVGTYFDQYLT